MSALVVLTAQLSMPGSLAQAQTASPGSEAELVAQAPTSVNINTASAAELATLLNGVGGSKAEAIVRYREQFGLFESVDELSEVTGIGAATVERNRALMRVQ
ncbi:MAG: ComEA family DNA-binding protein [Congregibacter sp.]|nr:ComEA family DNA-binding protein [Congregibacter sp.]MDP5070292.1 ComEA family DNA-binding protein [Congregibacter sp.]